MPWWAKKALVQTGRRVPRVRLDFAGERLSPRDREHNRACAYVRALPAGTTLCVLLVLAAQSQGSDSPPVLQQPGDQHRAEQHPEHCGRYAHALSIRGDRTGANGDRHRSERDEICADSVTH